MKPGPPAGRASALEHRYQLWVGEVSDAPVASERGAGAEASISNPLGSHGRGFSGGLSVSLAKLTTLQEFDR
jgi:hypothetical protein